MYLIKLSLFVTFWLNIFQNVISNENRIKLSRRKRYVAFPEGATFSAVYCLTSQMGITDHAIIFREGIDWGFAYKLPNNTVPLFLSDRITQKRRNRRELYIKIEDILTSMGYNGKSCILRSICEAQHTFKSRETSLIYQILNIIFNFHHDQRVLPNEPYDHRLYHWASQIGRKTFLTNNDDDSRIESDEEYEQKEDECSDIFQCPFSLIDMALGYYSKRRYLAFPEGSGFYAVFCLTSLMDISGTDLFTQNINWGLDYELPNDTRPLIDIYKPATKRRNRRQLYSGIETILTSMGYNGRSCILRTLCESQQYFTSRENSLIYHILNLIFKFPQEKLLPNEPEIHRIYHYATEMGTRRKIHENSEEIPDKCSEIFSCPFLLTDLILGHYNSHQDLDN